LDGRSSRRFPSLRSLRWKGGRPRGGALSKPRRIGGPTTGPATSAYEGEARDRVRSGERRRCSRSRSRSRSRSGDVPHRSLLLLSSHRAPPPRAPPP
jgi:hypothetical protein